MQANQPDLIDRFSDSFFLMANFGDLMNAKLYQEIHTQSRLSLMTEFKSLMEERDKDLAMAKYHSSKSRLLVMQAELHKLSVDKDKERKKLIAGLNKELTEMLGMLEFIKKRYID